MSEIKDRFEVFDQVEVPELWSEAQRREPRPTKRNRSSGARKAVVVVTAFALTVAATGIVVRAFHGRRSTAPVTSVPRDWPIGRVRELGLSFRYPPQWRLQSFNENIGTAGFVGVLISDTHLVFDHPPVRNGATSAWDMRALPSEGVAISIEHLQGPPSPLPAAPETALPLDLSKAELVPHLTKPSFTPPPGRSEERFLPFVLDGRNDGIRVFLGPDVSARSRQAVAEIVASIRSARPVPAGQIAFSQADGLYLASTRGTNVRPLTTVRGDEEPAWSPDGSKLAFVRYHHGVGSIYIVDANGADPHLVKRDATAPAWSPDGSQLAFVKGQSDVPGRCGLYVMGPDGSHVRLVTNRLCPAGIAWSPTGGWIAFGGFPGYGLNGAIGPIKIDVIRPDGTGLHQLSAGSTNDVSPSWSPDGRRIAFESDRGGYSPGSIVVMNADGSDPRRYTPGTLLVYSPAWSPDGRWLTFASGPTSTQISIFVMRANLTDVHRLAVRPSGSGAYPAWRP